MILEGIICCIILAIGILNIVTGEKIEGISTICLAILSLFFLYWGIFIYD